MSRVPTLENTMFNTVYLGMQPESLLHKMEAIQYIHSVHTKTKNAAKFRQRKRLQCDAKTRHYILYV